MSCKNKNSRCFQHICLTRRKCQEHTDCGHGHRCCWGECFKVSIKGSCTKTNQPPGPSYRSISNKNLIGRCPPPLKCIDDVCRPQPCYSKNDCLEDEECLKWPGKQAIGTCYDPVCNKHEDCPPGLGCNAEAKLCLKNFCLKQQDCGPMYECIEGSCILIKCVNDFECGSRVIWHFPLIPLNLFIDKFDFCSIDVMVVLAYQWSQKSGQTGLVNTILNA